MPHNPSPLRPTADVDLSIVIPVYGCSSTLRALHERLTLVLSAQVGSYEIIFVDDRGRDCSWPILSELVRKDPRVVACRLSRNFGQQIAITAGLAEARGRHVAVMDCDLQDPPEFIPTLLATARSGKDIVFAKRKAAYQSPFRMAANRTYFKLLSALSGRTLDGELGAFSIISRRVVDAFLLFRERDRHYLMILNWLGFDFGVVEYDRDMRNVGSSGYSLMRLIRHALSGVFFTTTRLLHWVVYAGLTLAGSGCFLAGLFILRWLLVGAAPGWTSLIVVQLIVGGIITLCIGIAALYVGKIFEAVQERPLYIVQEKIDARTAGNSAADEKSQIASF